jgi:hypothetical protein
MFREWAKGKEESLRQAALARYYANPIKAKLNNAAWRKANPDKSRARNRASWHRHREKRIKESIENGRKKPLLKKARCQAYRARQRKAEGRFTAAEFKHRVDSQNGRCFYCQTILSTPVAEHMIPLCRGGSNWISNIVASCASCNASKGTKTHVEFLFTKFLSNFTHAT